MLIGLSEKFPSGTPAFIWGDAVSLKGFSGSVKDKDNNSYQLSGVADINGSGEISLVLNFSKNTAGKNSHIPREVVVYDLPEDEIGAYCLDPVTGRKSISCSKHTISV